MALISDTPDVVKYALRISQYINGSPTGKPDGMFIRGDGLLTERMQSVLLLDTMEQATIYGTNWKTTTVVQYSGPLFVVECAVKFVPHSVINSVGEIC